MIIYLSGPMSGLPNNNYPEFHRVAAELSERGFEVLSPADIVLPQELLDHIGNDQDELWNEYMKRAIPLLMQCNTIAMLKGWQQSKGARIELFLAKELDYVVIDAYTLNELHVVSDLDIEELPF